jgi:hypothetical protein
MTPEIVIDRLRCYLRWNAARIDALDEDHEPIANPACYTRGKGDRLEYWITAATWRDFIFSDDYEAEAPRILCDAGLLRPLDHANLQVCAKIRGKVTKIYALRAEVVSLAHLQSRAFSGPIKRVKLNSSKVRLQKESGASSYNRLQVPAKLG